MSRKRFKLLPYWKKSCTTWDVKPYENGIFWIFTGWPEFWTMNSVHHVSLTFCNVCVHEIHVKKINSNIFCSATWNFQLVLRKHPCFPTLYITNLKKNKSSPPVVIPSPLAYAHCATGEAKAKSTGAAYEEVKVAKDQLNMAFVEKKRFGSSYSDCFFFDKYMAIYSWFFSQNKSKRLWQYLFLRFHTPRMISIPFVKSQACLLSKHQLVGLEVWSASLHLRGLTRFRAPFLPSVGFLENMTENLNWNSNSNVLLGPSTLNLLGDSQAPPLMTEILIMGT